MGKERELKRTYDLNVEKANDTQERRDLNILAPIIYLKCEQSMTEEEKQQRIKESKPQVNGGCFRIRSSGTRVPLHNHGDKHNFLRVTEGSIQQTTFTTVTKRSEKNAFKLQQKKIK